MAKFRFSAFADEYSANFDEQLIGLETNRIGMIELRGIDGKSVADISEAECREVKSKLDAHSIEVSAVGSPIGKININDDFAAHKGLLRRMCEYANILDTKFIRMFSFYITEGEDPADYRDKVMEQIGEMLDIADEYGVKLCHENERGIYGDITERCLDIMNVHGNRLGFVFDPCNFLLAGSKPFPDGFELLKPYITYMHIKDADSSGIIVEAGNGLGGIPEMIAVLNRERDDEIILTLEPHLKSFDGLEALETTGQTFLGHKYKDSKDSFRAAITALRNCLPRNTVSR